MKIQIKLRTLIPCSFLDGFYHLECYFAFQTFLVSNCVEVYEDNLFPMWNLILVKF